MVTSSSNMTLDDAGGLSSAASTCRSLRACSKSDSIAVNPTVTLSVHGNTVVSECRYSVFGTIAFGMRRPGESAPILRSQSGGGCQRPAAILAEQEPSWMGRACADDVSDGGAQLHASLRQRLGRGVEPQLGRLIEMRTHFAAHPGVVVVEPVEFLRLSIVRSIRLRSIGASVSVSKPFIGFSAPAISAATTSSRFSMRMPKASVL